MQIQFFSIFLGSIACCGWAIGIFLSYRQGNQRIDPTKYEIASVEIEQKIRFCKSQNDTTGIEKVYRDAIKRFPNAHKLYLKFDEFLVEQGDRTASVELLSNLQRKFRFNSATEGSTITLTNIRLIQSLIEIGRYDDAKIKAEKCLRNADCHPIIGQLYARIFERTQNPARQLEVLEQNALRFQSDYQTHLVLASVYDSLNLFSESDSLLENCVNMFPDTLEVYLRYSRHAHEAKLWELASQRWKLTLERFVLNKEAYEKAIESLLFLGKEEEAMIIIAKQRQNISNI